MDPREPEPSGEMERPVFRVPWERNTHPHMRCPGRQPPVPELEESDDAEG